MPAIPIQQARQLFTQSFLGSWKESYPVTNFLRSFTTDKVTPSKLVSLEVSRGTNKIAADVLRGSESNRNKFGRSTMKNYQPPYYAESFTNEDLALYDQLFAQAGEIVDTELVKAAVQEVTENYLELKNKIERAYERQVSQVLQTGIVTLKNGDNIDFKRKGALMVTVDIKWDTSATATPTKNIKSVCDVLRKNGAAAAEFDVILGSSAVDAFFNTAEYQSKYALHPITIDDYNMPRMNETSGAVFLTRIPIGPYKVNLWSYLGHYTDENGNDTDYIDPKNVIVIAKSANIKMSFGAVPRVLTDNGIMQNQQFANVLEGGKYFLNNFVKQEVSSHIFEIKSAGVAVPVTIDHFATLKVLA